MYSPKGIGVAEGEFDVLYGKGIARLSLMQYEQLEQGDRELYMDVSDERVVGFREIFGMMMNLKGAGGEGGFPARDNAAGGAGL